MFTIVAHVRKRNAIGIFYNHSFELDINTKEEWFRVFGNEWELHHFVSQPM